MKNLRSILSVPASIILIFSIIGCGDPTQDSTGPTTVVISPTSAPTDHITTVDATGGHSSNLALDTQGRPVICFFNESTEKIYFFSWAGFDWLTAESIASAPSGLSMAYSNITDEAFFAFYDSSGALSAGNYDYVSSAGGTVDPYTNVSAGDHAGVSIALDGSDHSHISYYGTPEGSLKYAEWTGAVWNITTVDARGNVGKYSSIALSAQGSPEISYYDITNGNLKFACRNGSAWDIATVESTDDIGLWTSIAIDGNGITYISYYDNTNAKLKCASSEGSGWVKRDVDSSNVGKYSSIKIDSNGNPWISYYADSGGLKLASWEGTGWDIHVVESGTDVGRFTSLALDSTTNAPRISYFDASRVELKYYWE